MDLRGATSHFSERLVTGAYIWHSGFEKWSGTQQQAEGLHGMASAAYPFLQAIPPATFLRALAIGEMTTGTLLLMPFVPDRVAGIALTGFSGALVTMYLRTPSMHKPRSVWPTQGGVAVSKDVWMLGIGVGLVLESLLGAE